MALLSVDASEEGKLFYSLLNFLDAIDAAHAHSTPSKKDQFDLNFDKSFLIPLGLLLKEH